MNDPEKFKEDRKTLNKIAMEHANRDIKRFYNLDSAVYADGALPAKTKEMLGLAASMVLRCDDCIRYHLTRCHEKGVSDEEMAEIMAIALIVGGSIVIPHHRRAMEFWGKLKGE